MQRKNDLIANVCFQSIRKGMGIMLGQHHHTKINLLLDLLKVLLPTSHQIHPPLPRNPENQKLDPRSFPPSVLPLLLAALLQAFLPPFG